MSQISWATRQIAYELGRAGLLGILGATEEVNVQGEVVQKLDTIANDAFLRAFEYGELVGEVVSEEMEQPAQILGNDKGKYVIFVDPLDGSSNIDVTVGSIFSVHRRPKGVTGTDLVKALKIPGNQQVAAGYALYGSSTMLVFTTGNGVHGFTLEPGLGEFLLSHENIRIPQRGSTYSINEGRRLEWFPPTKGYIDHLQQTDKATNRPYSARSVGSLVAD